jgi:gliding motility-associated lipoprotein GldH
MNCFSKSINGLIIISILFTLFSCGQIEVFEKSTPIPNHAWKSNFPCSGTFIISDTSNYYDIYAVLRHTDTYKYNNIWVNVGLQPPGDSMSFQKINLSLGDDANGWQGSGMDDIWEVRKQLTEGPKKFRKVGLYHFSLYNIMRDDPLLHVISAGLRVEKIKG